MKRRVVAYAIDGLGPAMLESWIARGDAPRLAELRARGAWGRLRVGDDTPYESVWQTFLQGSASRASDPRPRASFYAQPRANLAIFDVPHAPLLASLEGIQLLGWGMEQNESTVLCSPPGAMADITRRHGPHPVFGGPAARITARDGEPPVTGYRLPSLYDADALRALENGVRAAMRSRASIVRELLAKGPWDLLLAASAEIHVAAHMLWHFGFPHPLAAVAGPARDPLAALARTQDEALGDIVAAAPRDAVMVVFSLSGMSANHADLPIFLFLPEFLYRLYRGQPALAAGDPGLPPPAPALHYRRHWKDEIWSMRTAHGEAELESPDAQERRGDPFDWSPLNWYRPVWPRIPAFALPGFSHGLIRLNLKGRDVGGVVEPGQRGRVCDALATALGRLVNARTGKPIVRDVGPAADVSALGMAADLVVRWNDTEPADVVESPDIGRIGPVPFLRSGGHAPDGFCVVCAPGIAPGSHLPDDARVEDLSATLLGLMGASIPSYMVGRPFRI